MIMKFLKLKVNYRIKCTIRQRKASQLTHTHKHAWIAEKCWQNNKKNK